MQQRFSRGATVRRHRGAVVLSAVVQQSCRDAAVQRCRYGGADEVLNRCSRRWCRGAEVAQRCKGGAEVVHSRNRAGAEVGAEVHHVIVQVLRFCKKQ